MNWVNRDDLLEWLKTEEDEMRDIDDREAAHEASYIRKHVRQMPEMDVYQAMQELKRYCDERPNCFGCPIRGCGLCLGTLPMAYRPKEIEHGTQEDKREEQ